MYEQFLNFTCYKCPIKKLFLYDFGTHLNGNCQKILALFLFVYYVIFVDNLQCKIEEHGLNFVIRIRNSSIKVKVLQKASGKSGMYELLYVVWLLSNWTVFVRTV